MTDAQIIGWSALVIAALLSGLGLGWVTGFRAGCKAAWELRK